VRTVIVVTRRRDRHTMTGRPTASFPTAPGRLFAGPRLGPLFSLSCGDREGQSNKNWTPIAPEHNLVVRGSGVGAAVLDVRQWWRPRVGVQVVGYRSEPRYAFRVGPVRKRAGATGRSILERAPPRRATRACVYAVRRPTRCGTSCAALKYLHQRRTRFPALYLHGTTRRGRKHSVRGACAGGRDGRQ